MDSGNGMDLVALLVAKALRDKEPHERVEVVVRVASLGHSREVGTVSTGPGGAEVREPDHG